MQSMYYLLTVFLVETIRILIMDQFAALFLHHARLKNRVIADILGGLLMIMSQYIVANNCLVYCISFVCLGIVSISYSCSLRKKLSFVTLLFLTMTLISIYLDSTLISDSYMTRSLSEIHLLFLAFWVAKRISFKSCNVSLDNLQWFNSLLLQSIFILFSSIVFLADKFSSFHSPIISVSILTINVLFCYFLEIYDKNACAKYEFEKELEIKQAGISEMYAFRHDMKHHLSHLLFLNENKKTEEIHRYIQKMAESMNENLVICNTGNLSVDKILNRMFSEAKSKGIEVKKQIVIPENILLPDFDMNIILGNLLENAIEATEKTDNPQIHVFVKYVRESLIIEVSNTYLQSQLHEPAKYKSSKSDNPLHGHGLNNVKKALHKYDHELVFEEKDGKFTVKVLMNLADITDFAI